MGSIKRMRQEKKKKSINSKKSVEVDELAACSHLRKHHKNKKFKFTIESSFPSKVCAFLYSKYSTSIIGTNPGHFSDNFA